MKKNILILILVFCLVAVAQSVSAETVTKNVNVSFTIEPAFAVKVTFLEGGTGLDFGDANVLPKGTTVTRTAEVRVVSNYGLPYKMTQKVERTFTDEKGYDLPEDMVTFYVKPLAETKGKAEVSSPENLKGEKQIFTSGPKGESDRFLIIYELESPGLIKAGRYSASISVTASM